MNMLTSFIFLLKTYGLMTFTLFPCCWRSMVLICCCRIAIMVRSCSVRATEVEGSRRFLRELDKAPGGNNLHYILQCLRVPALVTRVWTRKGCRVAMECSWNDGSKTQYYYVILNRLLGRSRGLERAPEWRVRGPLTFTPPPRLLHLEAIVPDLKRMSKSIRRMCLGAAGCLR